MNHSKQTKQKIGEQTRKYMSDPLVKKKHSDSIRSFWKSDKAIKIKKEYSKLRSMEKEKRDFELNKKDLVISIVTEHDMRLTAIIDAIHSRMIKQGLDPRCLDESKAHYPSGMVIKKEIKIRQGIEKETSKKILKDIKDSKIKVTAQLMDDIIRVSSKSINDLQAVIALCRKGEYEVPLQFVNMK
jgi:uncharacterized protein YajQ (UPF0234 family)